MLGAGGWVALMGVWSLRVQRVLVSSDERGDRCASRRVVHDEEKLVETGVLRQ